jgi:hypothetical protein
MRARTAERAGHHERADRQVIMKKLDIHNVATLMRYTVSSGGWNPTACALARLQSNMQKSLH